ncbi:hypothetical protein BST61_g6466 [Cercospora zeina]
MHVAVDPGVLYYFGVCFFTAAHDSALWDDVLKPFDYVQIVNQHIAIPRWQVLSHMEPETSPARTHGPAADILLFLELPFVSKRKTNKTKTSNPAFSRARPRRECSADQRQRDPDKTSKPTSSPVLKESSADNCGIRPEPCDHLTPFHYGPDLTREVLKRE